MEEIDDPSPGVKEQKEEKPNLMLNLDKVHSMPVADSGVSSVVSHKGLLDVEVGKKGSILGQFFGSKNQKIGIKEPSLQ